MCAILHYSGVALVRDAKNSAKEEADFCSGAQKCVLYCTIVVLH